MTLWEKVEEFCGICHFTNETAKCPECGSNDLLVRDIEESVRTLDAIYYCAKKRYFAGDHLGHKRRQVITCRSCGKDVEPKIEGER